MKKIPSLFVRDFNTGIVTQLITPGTEWAHDGEGYGTVKIDGSCCRIWDGIYYKRYDRKIKKSAYLQKASGDPWSLSDFKAAPKNWKRAEPNPNLNTGHWPGWVPVNRSNADKWHREAWVSTLDDGTYELIGPKIQGNPYGKKEHVLVPHGKIKVECPRSFIELADWLRDKRLEGVVFCHPDGRMAKIKKRDFNQDWPNLSVPLPTFDE